MATTEQCASPQAETLGMYTHAATVSELEGGVARWRDAATRLERERNLGERESERLFG